MPNTQYGIHRRPTFFATAVLLLLMWRASDGFTVSIILNTKAFSRQSHSDALFASRYGPPLDDMGEIEELQHYNGRNNNDDFLERQKTDFRQLLEKVLTASKPEHVPSLLTKHTELILGMQGELAVETVEEILEESRQKGGETDVERVAEAIEMVLSFAEDFVNQSRNMDQSNQQLLGKIIRTMTQAEGSDREREENLDALLCQEREHFTRGFLRHLDGECERIASAPTISQESRRLRETLLVIKTRIVEELGKELGEGALVLGQLVAYDDANERKAVLEAGLTVRGLEFAVELQGLTEEALEGFQAVPGGVDPSLVSRVVEIDERVKSFIAQNGDFQ